MAFLLTGTAAVLTMGAMPALADNGPHVSTAYGTITATSGGIAAQASTGNTVNTDRCAGCHRAHTAQGAYLLNGAAEATALCETCHGTSGTGATTDVVDGLGYGSGRAGTPMPLRAGGFLNAQIGTATLSTTSVLSPYTLTASVDKTSILIAPSATFVTGGLGNTTSAHSIDGTAQTAWGAGNATSGTTPNAGTSVALDCTSCHDPHGNGNYRILRPAPQGAPAGATPVVISDVALGTARSYTTTNYWIVNAQDQTTTATYAGNSHGAKSTLNSTPFLYNISAWCSTCHTRILAPSGAYNTAQQGTATAQGPQGGTLVAAKAGGTIYAASGYLMTTTQLAVGTTVLFTGFQLDAGLALNTAYQVLSSGSVGTGFFYAQITTQGGLAAISIANGGNISFVANPVTVAAPAGTPISTTFTIPDGVTTLTAGTPIIMTYVAGTQPLLNRNWIYYVVSPAVGSFQLAATAGGTAINFGNSGWAAYALNPGNDAMYTFRHRSDAGFLSSSSQYDNNPNCITCHVAHGSDVAATGFAAAVTNPDGSTTGLHAGGDSFLLRVDNRGTCKMCHNL
jgi:predicted CXXCH cytochrome family protein